MPLQVISDDMIDVDINGVTLKDIERNGKYIYRP